MALPFPVLYVRPNSQNVISTNGQNPLTGGVGLSDNAGNALLSSTYSAFFTVTNPNGVVRLNQGAMTFFSPGVWQYVTAASVMADGDGPWTGKVEIFDNTGVSGTKYATFFYSLQESAT